MGAATANQPGQTTGIFPGPGSIVGLNFVPGNMMGDFCSVSKLNKLNYFKNLNVSNKDDMTRSVF